MDFKEFKRLYLANPRKKKDTGLIEFDTGNSLLDKKFNALQITEEEYKSYLKKFIPELSEYYANRKRLTENLKSKDSTYFAEIPQEQKLDYLEAFIEGKREDDEWKALSLNKKLINNLQVCLYGLKPTNEQIKQERYLMRRFMNLLVFSGFKEKLKDNDGEPLYSKWDSLSIDEKKETINDFVKAYERIYEIDEIEELEFENQKRNGCYFDDERKICLNEELFLGKKSLPIEAFAVLFHELTHARQRKLEAEDFENYRIFNNNLSAIKEPVLQYNPDVNKHDFYTLEPDEMYAHFFQEEFENMLVNEVWEGRLKKNFVRKEMWAPIMSYYQGKNR